MSTPEIHHMLDEAQDFGIGVYNAWTVGAANARGSAGNSAACQRTGPDNLAHHQRPAPKLEGEGASLPGPSLRLSGRHQELQRATGHRSGGRP